VSARRGAPVPDAAFSTSNKKTDSQPGDAGRAIKFLRQAARTWIYIPDGQIGWFPHALRAGKRLLETQRIDAIYSTSFPVTAHLIAYKLKQATNIPWVADFRDLWTENHYAEYSSELRKRLDQGIESKFLAAADTLVTVSDAWAETLRKLTRGHKRVKVIRNGFDSSELAGIEHTPPAKWTITYVGLFYGAKQDPSALLETLRRLIDDGRIPREDVRFNIVGEPDSYVKDLVARYGISDLTCFTGFVSHQEALAYQVNASLLLLFLHSDRSDIGHVPGKLYEYLGARRPILAIVPPNFEVARIIRETHAGMTVEATDLAGIEQCLLDSYLAYKSGREVLLSESDLSPYERRHGAQRLADLLNELTAISHTSRGHSGTVDGTR
jgi:glycosyltransferase involved in cell wall biosynthesis